MSCPGLTCATARPAPVRVRSPAPSPEPKIRCLSPRLVDEDVMMYECEEAPASVRLPGVPHPVIPEAASCLQSVVVEPDAPVCPAATASAEVDTHDDDEGEELEEWEEEDGEVDHDLPSSANATTGSLFNNRAKPPNPPPRAAPAPMLQFERPIELQAPPPTLASSGLTGVKIEDESELEDGPGGLWIRGEPTRIPGSFLPPPDRLGSESATSGGHPKSTSERMTGSKESSESCGTEPARAQPQEPEGEHEISINLATGTETASLDLHLTSGSVAASTEHSATPTSEPTFDLKVMTKAPGRFSISAAWRTLRR